MNFVHPAGAEKIARLAPIEAESKPGPSAGGRLDNRPLKVAVIHDWCPDFRGGEQVLARICRQFPHAEIFTLFDFLPEAIKQSHFRGVSFHTSILNLLPMVRKYYRYLFFLCPFFIEQFDVTDYDLVISSSAAFARGVLTRPDQPHVCYVHSPVRYAWDEQFSYLKQGRLGFGPKGLLFRYLLHKLRTWDTRTAHGPDIMLANSSYVRSRIRRTYGRHAEVVHPPISLEELPLVVDKADYYVSASFLAPYKRIDLAIRAFNEMPDHRLVVAGDGQQAGELRALAGPNVTFTGFLPREEFVRTIASAKALIFVGCEDFGISLAEAQACGTPVIALGRGGALDIVRDLGASPRPTGILFARQTAAAVKEAILAFENQRLITPYACRTNAARFSGEAFDKAIGEAVDVACRLHAAQ